MRFWQSIALSGLASAAVLPRDDPSNSKLAKCPGYKASNVKASGSGLTANLELAGKACDVYGDDLKELTLDVAYQSGKCTVCIQLVVMYCVDDLNLTNDF